MSDVIPTPEDRLLVAEATNRAIDNWCRAQWGRDANLMPPQDLTKRLFLTPALKTLVVEAEIAVATARQQERERCAEIAIAIVRECLQAANTSDGEMNSVIEATAMTIATQIRSGVCDHDR